jgi:hypothetical protein
MSFFEQAKQLKDIRADVGKISWVRGSFDFVMFQFQTDFLSIMTHRAVHMHKKIEPKFFSVIRPFLWRE